MYIVVYAHAVCYMYPVQHGHTMWHLLPVFATPRVTRLQHVTY